MIPRSIRDYSEAELLYELERRKHPEPEPMPAFTCDRCGAKEFYYGDWKPHLFERYMRGVEERHADCPLSVEGGGI